VKAKLMELWLSSLMLAISCLLQTNSTKFKLLLISSEMEEDWMMYPLETQLKTVENLSQNGSMMTLTLTH
jgi:hypothetical protein